MIGHASHPEVKPASERDTSPDVAARLAPPLYAHVGSLMAAHVAGLFLGALAVVRVGGLWSAGLPAASLAAMASRMWILRRIRRLPAPLSVESVPRWRIQYQVVGVAWCTISAALCGVCFIAGDELLRLFASLIVFGTTAGIASRSASAPRFALIQISIWLLSLTMLAPRLDYGGWIVPLAMLVYFFALVSILRRHHKELVAVVDAQQASQRTQHALAEREAALQAIFANAAAGITEIDVPGRRYLRVNKVFCDMLGRSEAELVGVFDPWRFIHPEDQAEQFRQWAELQETGRSFECETRFIHREGSIVWCQLSVSVSASDAEGHFLRAVAMVQDITKRKAAEIDLRASQDLLVLSLDIGGVGTFRRDYKAGLIHCSRETRVMNGLPLDDEPIRAERWLATLLPEDVPRFLKDAADAHAERRSIVSFDYRFLHPESGVRYAETRSQVTYDEAGLAVWSVGVVIDVTDRRRAESRLFHLAHHDPLTDLPNRSLFRTRLDKVLEHARQGGQFAILCLDLDHFKDVNDTLGHPIGDSLLQSVTRRLQAVCRPTDTVARLGGDEFAVIQSPLDDPADARALAERLAGVLSAPYDIESHRVVIGASIGIAVAPSDGLDPDLLLRNADMALYCAKDAGRGCHRFFKPMMHERMQAKRVLDGELRQALADETLELFYQPLVDVATHRIRGFEALIRWRHAERGLIMPDAFIPLAQSNGLIVPIGAFVLHRACTQAAAWGNGMTVAVNLSASEFASPGLFDTVAAALRQAALDPKRLELEITETTMLQDTQATLEMLRRLKALGVRLSMDDFGTGFSSLSYLQRFPFDKVKIDRSFIEPLGRTRESLAIVGAVVDLCAGLDMETTAEGVETEDQLAILTSIGCTEAQGYYFSRPRPIDEIPDLIARLDAAALRRLADASSMPAFVGNRLQPLARDGRRRVMSA